MRHASLLRAKTLRRATRITLIVFVSFYSLASAANMAHHTANATFKIRAITLALSTGFSLVAGTASHRSVEAASTQSKSGEDNKLPTLLRKKRRIALCYVRQSMTRDQKDMLSPKRQIQYIEKYLATDPDLEVLWFTDADGHRSGRSEKGRPEFQKLLEELLTNPYVEQIVVTEFARLARSVFTSAKMIEMMKERQVNLVFAYQNKVADLKTSEGRLRLHFEAIMNEYYSDYVSMMATVAIANKRVKGQWVGGLPFATYLKNGMLKLEKRRGAWLLTDGRYVAGRRNKPPTPGAIFRLYCGTLKQTYELYLADNSADSIALELNRQGCPFEDQHGKPCAISRNHVRTLLAEWPAYGGNYALGRAKDRPGYKDPDPDSLKLDAKRAVLDLSLAYLVGHKRKERGEKPTDDHGITADSNPLPLAQVVRCATCDQIATYLDDPHRLTRLGGTWKSNGQGYYRHQPDHDCGCHSRSVRKEVLEQKFVNLLHMLQPRPETFSAFLNSAKQIDERVQVDHQGMKDMKEERSSQIQRLGEMLRRIEKQYRELTLDDESYDKRRTELHQKIQELKLQDLDETVIDLPLTEFVALLQHPALLWENLDMPGQRALAYGLFEWILYDMDTGEFVGWTLSSWAHTLFTFDKSEPIP